MVAATTTQRQRGYGRRGEETGRRKDALKRIIGMNKWKGAEEKRIETSDRHVGRDDGVQQHRGKSGETMKRLGQLVAKWSRHTIKRTENA